MQIYFSKIKNRLLTVTGYLLKDQDDAEDAVQETFCRLWQIREKISDENEATAIAIKTARNICIDQLRRKKIVRYEALDDYENYCSDNQSQHQLEVQDEYQIVRQLIEERLSPLQQKILLMKEVEGYEIDEIAEELNMNNSAVRMNLSRARKDIRSLYLEINPL